MFQCMVKIFCQKWNFWELWDKWDIWHKISCPYIENYVYINISCSGLKMMIAYQINSSGMATRFTPKTLMRIPAQLRRRSRSSLRPTTIYVCLDNGLLPGRHQAILWTIARILVTEPLITNFREILIKSRVFYFWKIQSNMSSGKWGSSCWKHHRGMTSS